MKRHPYYILHIALPVMVSSVMFLAEPATAESVIRIIGNSTTKSPNYSGEPTAAEPPRSSLRQSGTIRIIGDKPGAVPLPVGEAARPELSPPVTPAKEIRIIGDKAETVQKKAPEQPAVIESVEKEHKKTAAEEDAFSKEAAELLLTQRLKALKAEEERKAVEKAEQERLAQARAEQEKVEAEAAQRAAIEQEQRLLAARKAEESRKEAEKAEQERLAKEKGEREKAAVEAAQQATLKKEQERLAARKAAEKAEQERIAALKADEERRAEARKALAEMPLPAQQPTAGAHVAGSSAPSLTDENQAVPETAETIWNLYLAAKSNDPALGRTEARVTGSRAESDVLFSTLMPHLDSSAGVKQISQAVTKYNASSDGNYDFTSLNVNVTARLTLLHVPTLYSLSAAAAGLSGELAGVAAARQSLIVKLTDSYFSLLKAQADKQIAQGEINRLKQVLDQSHAFLKAGTGDVIAVYEAQSRLDGAGADLTRSESTLRLAEQKLSTVVGKPVTSVVNYLPRQPMGPEPDNLDWWVATMEKEQPAVRQAREGVTQTAEQRKAVKAEYLPVLQASGGYDVNRGTAALPTAEVRQWFVGASISLPLYSGGETAAKVRRAVASEEERRHIFDETMDLHRENVKQAFFNLRYNISFIKALEQKKASAEIQLAAVSKGRKIGTRNAIDLLNAEQAYSIALRDYKYALYDNFIRIIQLRSAAGILGDTDVFEVSKSVAPATNGILDSLASSKPVSPPENSSFLTN